MGVGSARLCNYTAVLVGSSIPLLLWLLCTCTCIYLCTLGSSVFALCAVYTNVCTVAILYMQTHCFVFCRSKARTGCGGSRG